MYDKTIFRRDSTNNYDSTFCLIFLRYAETMGCKIVEKLHVGDSTTDNKKTDCIRLLGNVSQLREIINSPMTMKSNGTTDNVSYSNDDNNSLGVQGAGAGGCV
jgi:hypothetical protein